jgi:CRISPR-associated protein Csm2
MNNQQREQIQNFILSDDNAEQMVKEAENISENMINKVSASQLRKIYGAIKKLEMSHYDEKVYRQLVLIKPKLTYMRGRSKKDQKLYYENLEQIFGAAIDAVKKDDDTTFQRFCQFIEAILAYHKVYGDK